MEKFIAYEKLSKKEQKKLNSAKRGSWGLVKPITKVKESAKIYNRKKKQDFRSFAGFQSPAFCFWWVKFFHDKSLGLWYCLMDKEINECRGIKC